MKKAGLITIYDVPNYGSVLQTYATLYVLRKLGFDVTTIQYTRKNEWVQSHKRGGSANFIIKLLANKLRLTPFGRMAHKMWKFRYKFLHLTREFNSLEDLEQADWSKYDLMVTGSDQVWNAKYIYGDSVYMLSFVPDDVRKISIASSFAMSNLPDMYVSKYRKWLGRYDALSVREKGGLDIIKGQLGLKQPTEVLLDPTLLLSRKEWSSLFAQKKKLPHKYILFYMLDYAFNPKPYIFEVAKYFQGCLDCPILALVGHKRPSCANGLKMKNVGDAGIDEFVDLFENAALVITSSFHGTAFALNFGRPLVSIVPSNGDDRQLTLIRELGVENCAVSVGTAFDVINPFYDTQREQNVLERIRESSIKWISKYSQKEEK